MKPVGIVLPYRWCDQALAALQLASHSTALGIDIELYSLCPCKPLHPAYDHNVRVLDSVRAINRLGRCKSIHWFTTCPDPRLLDYLWTDIRHVLHMPAGCQPPTAEVVRRLTAVTCRDTETRDAVSGMYPDLAVVLDPVQPHPLPLDPTGRASRLCVIADRTCWPHALRLLTELAWAGYPQLEVFAMLPPVSRSQRRWLQRSMVMPYSDAGSPRATTTLPSVVSALQQSQWLLLLNQRCDTGHILELSAACGTPVISWDLPLTRVFAASGRGVLIETGHTWTAGRQTAYFDAAAAYNTVLEALRADIAPYQAACSQSQNRILNPSQPA